MRYEIADNGRGIEAKIFERIFDLFRRTGVNEELGHFSSGGALTYLFQPEVRWSAPGR
mgnify:CR=1 FL=1